MGNRATVIFTEQIGRRTEIGPAVYLHWNGGANSVYAFLAELLRREANGSVDYTTARFVQLVGEFFDGDGTGSRNLSLGVSNGPRNLTLKALERHCPGNNGIYLIDSRTLTVRRFVVDVAGLRELDAAGVTLEKNTAERSPYGPEIARLFQALDAARATLGQTDSEDEAAAA